MAHKWYLAPRALKVLADLRANTPAHQPNTSANPLTTTAAHVSPEADALRILYAVAFHNCPEADRRALNKCSADEVLAGMFGCPDGLDWAHPDRAAYRAALAAEIDAALSMGVAA